MNFDYSEDEKVLKETLRRLLASRNGRRRVLDGGESFDRPLWAALAESGWLAAGLPEAFGGQDLGPVALCAIAEELGFALAAVPFLGTTIGAVAVTLAGSGSQRHDLLPALGRGEVIAALAIDDEPQVAFTNGRLHGRLPAVTDGATAQIALVSARGDSGTGLCIVALDAPGVRRQARTSIDPTRPVSSLEFDHVPAEPLGRPGDGLIERLRDQAAVLAAFEQLGGADAALAMTRDYALARHAFGRPIGRFQAVKHKLADIYIGNELARANAYYAAWALAQGGPELPLAAATARVSATEAFDRAAREAIQIHGGISITWEHDCQLYYRRARHLAVTLGPPAGWRRRLVAALAVQHAA